MGGLLMRCALQCRNFCAFNLPVHLQLIWFDQWRGVSMNPQNAEALFLKFGPIEVGAFGYAAMAVVVVLAVLVMASRWLNPRV